LNWWLSSAFAQRLEPDAMGRCSELRTFADRSGLQAEHVVAISMKGCAWIIAGFHQQLAQLQNWSVTARSNSE
jgi:hypothetical protein